MSEIKEEALVNEETVKPDKLTDIADHSIIADYLKNLQNGYLNELVNVYNQRMSRRSKISELNVGLFRVGTTKDLHVMLYTPQKMLYDKLLVSDNEIDLRNELRKEMKTCFMYFMRYGMNYVIRRAPQIPEFLL